MIVVTGIELAVFGTILFLVGLALGLTHRIFVWYLVHRLVHTESARFCFVERAATNVMNWKTMTVRRYGSYLKECARKCEALLPKELVTPEDHVGRDCADALYQIGYAFDAIADSRVRWFGTLPERGDTP